MVKNSGIITLLSLTLVLHLIVVILFGLIIRTTINEIVTLPIAIIKMYTQTIFMFICWFLGILLAFVGIWVSRKNNRTFMWGFVGIFIVSVLLLVALIASIYVSND